VKIDTGDLANRFAKIAYRGRMATPLADVLLSRSGPADRLALEAALRRLVEELTARYAAFAVPPEAFVAHAARWIRPDREPLAALAELQLDQLYLAFAAARGEAAAIAEIEAHHLERARAALRSFDAATADEALQRMREALFVARGDRAPRIGDYAGRGDLAGWIRTTALREAFHLVAPTRSVANEAALDGYALPAADPAIELMKRQYGASFKQALAGALARLPEATRTTLRRYYVEGLGLEQIAALEGVVASTISRRLDKARRELHDETRRALADSLRVSDSEVDSILELLDSRLELSRSALAGPP
jgi:RNA polymerase sigma-70 factor, ECF subfamily